MTDLLPNAVLLRYRFLRKEAVWSSMTEGSQSSLADQMLFGLNEQPGVPKQYAREVCCLMAALEHGKELKNMQNLFEPLTDTELDQLDSFLLVRIEEHPADDGKDEGVLDVSELDGLFAALVSGPVVVQPSQWLPAVWGDFEPVWESAQEFEEILSLMIRHMNSVAALLMNQGDYYEPIFLERVQDGKTYPIVDEWCEGYLRGVALAAAQWEAAGMDMAVLLAPIRAFTEAAGWPAHELSSEVEIDNLRNAITPNVREIHAWWLTRREDDATVSQPARRPESHVGRNDLCPCGSGKKYKKCCLH